MDVDEVEGRYGDVVGLVEHLRIMGEVGGLVLQRREALKRDTALASAAIYQTMFRNSSSDDDDNNGDAPLSVVGSYQVIYMTGWSPGDSQPKAAKRSATVSFQDLSKDLGEESSGEAVSESGERERD